MLTHPTTDRLRELGLVGMARALEEQRRHAEADDRGLDERLAMLVEREALERDSKRLAARLRFAGLRQQATPEDVDHRAARGLDRALFGKLSGSNATRICSSPGRPRWRHDALFPHLTDKAGSPAAGRVRLHGRS